MVETREEIQKQFNALPDDSGEDQIRQTKEDLERRSFSPAFLLPVKNFLTMTKQELKQEIDRVLELDDSYLLKRAGGFSNDPKKIRCAHINLLLYFYHLLARLRLNIPEAWDEINELYEDD